LYILGDENTIAEYLKTDDYTKYPSEFTVGVHDPSVPANLRGEGIKVKDIGVVEAFSWEGTFSRSW